MPHRTIRILALGSLIICTLLFSLLKGSTSIPLYQLLFGQHTQYSTIFFQLRLPRTLAAFVNGGLLALAGALMQLLVQNPLADPYILGISSGAAFFTLLCMLIGISGSWLLGGAWLGSLLTILLILLLTKKHHWQTHALLLSGTAIASGFSAGISFILLMSPANYVHGMLFWLMGDLNDASLPIANAMILLCGTMICIFYAPGLNILSRGEKAARTLGLASKKYRIALYLFSSLCTAAAVTSVGCISFLGLIVPHLTRIIFGFNHRIMLPSAVLLGGSFLTLADTLARSCFAPEQLPVGILLALIGVPIFIWLLPT